MGRATRPGCQSKMHGRLMFRAKMMLMLVHNQNVCGVLVRPSSPKVQNGSEKTSIAPTPLLASRRCTFECSSETEESPGLQCLEISMGLGLEF